MSNNRIGFAYNVVVPPISTVAVLMKTTSKMTNNKYQQASNGYEYQPKRGYQYSQSESFKEGIQSNYAFSMNQSSTKC